MTRSLTARIARISAAALVTLTLASSNAWSQEHTSFAKEGGYVGVSGLLDFTFDGVTFDGESIYKEVGGEEFMILPRLDSRNMGRLILGFRGQSRAFELSYDRTHHRGTFLEGTGEATFQAINADGRFYFATRSRVQPQLLLGGAIPWLTIKDGSFLEDSVGDGRFKGFGVNIEPGVTVYPHPRLGVGVGYRYRVMWFDRATGVTDKLYELRPRFRETSGSVVLTGLFTF